MRHEHFVKSLDSGDLKLIHSSLREAERRGNPDCVAFASGLPRFARNDDSRQCPHALTKEAQPLAMLPADLQGLEKPFRSAAAVPDVPAAVGGLLVTAYTILIAIFAVTMMHSKEALLALAICSVFLTMYFSVPGIFLAVEPGRKDRPSFDHFLTKGLETYTGHCSGRNALVQMLLVPVALTICAFAMGVIALLII